MPDAAPDAELPPVPVGRGQQIIPRPPVWSLGPSAPWAAGAALTLAQVLGAVPDVVSPVQPVSGESRPSAVLVVLTDVGDGPEMLLTRRSWEMRSHRGEVSFPGGRMDPGETALDTALREAQAEAHRLGITGIHNVEGDAALAAFERLAASDALRLRVLFHPPVTSLDALVRRGIRSGAGSAWLRIGGVKLFLDGSLGSRTAWMLKPYQGSGDRGMPITSGDEAARAMRAAAAAGIASTVHAIGDAAVRRALDLMAPLPRVAIPHRIEHFQCVDEADLDRAAAAGLVVSMQPAHLLTDIPLVERHWGSRGRGAYAFGSLRRRRTPMVFGSDVPVASIDPREGLFAALERRSDAGGPAGGWRPEEKLSFGEAVHAYTVGAAHAAGGGRSGTLAPGQEADLVAWAFDPSVERGAGDAVRAGSARLTVSGGEVVMRR
jgi:predicted amidohydrolase YtcJ